MAKAKEKKQDIDTRREFTLETPENIILHYFIASPSGEDIRKADWQYSKIYNQAIVDGFLTQSQMVEFLKRKDILTDDYTHKLERVRTSLAAELFKLENLLEDADELDKESCALEVARLRDELFQINQTINGPMGNTCENLAEDSRTEYITSRIIETKDGEKLWDEYENYRQEDNTALCIKSRFEVMLWMQGLGSDFLENTPEQKILREISQTRLDKIIQENQQTDSETEIESSEETQVNTSEIEEISLKVPVKKSQSKNKGRLKNTTKIKTIKKIQSKKSKK